MLISSLNLHGLYTQDYVKDMIGLYYVVNLSFLGQEFILCYCVSVCLYLKGKAMATS